MKSAMVPWNPFQKISSSRCSLLCIVHTFSRLISPSSSPVMSFLLIPVPGIVTDHQGTTRGPTPDMEGGVTIGPRSAGQNTLLPRKPVNTPDHRGGGGTVQATTRGHMSCTGEGMPVEAVQWEPTEVSNDGRCHFMRNCKCLS